MPPQHKTQSFAHLRDERHRRLLLPGKQLSQLRYVPQALRLVWSAAPTWTAASVGLLIIQGILPIFSVYLTRAVVNSMVVVIQQGISFATLEPAVVSILLMGMVMLTGELLGSLGDYVRTSLAELVREKMSNLIHTKAISLDLQFYESPEYFDQLQRASIDAIDRPLGLLDSLTSLLQNSITLAAMAGVLFTFSWWLPLALLVGTLPALWVALRTTWKNQVWRIQHTMDQRRLAYYRHLLIGEQPAAEMRIFDLGSYFHQAYADLQGRLRKDRLDLSRQQMWAQIGAGLVGLVTLALSLAWMARQAIQGIFKLGDLAMFYQAMSQGQRLMRNLLTGMGEIYRNLLFLDDLFSFLDLQPLLSDPAEPASVPPGMQQGIHLRDVCFSYPDSQRIVLDHFNLDLPAGQITSIVGENGAGKSTLLKLLCRFYDPQEGSITWDGVDLRQMAQADLRRRITLLFQSPLAYHATAAENIAFGDMASNPTPEQIQAAARSASAQAIIDRLPEGYETVLGRWFGYTNLSVGEWQRVALARAFVRQADLVILDEPTSAMDSWAEAEWMSGFRKLVAGRTALIITHRFTTAMQADIIHVVDEGRVVESGSHDELVELGGLYASSWKLQMREARDKIDSQLQFSSELFQRRT